ncbi:DUF87 domain-containing protein [Paenisporosarcina cavernae]|uniref:DUF87 domain-containing protein n=2 Tax=Paenisporosarcina cavernae TaxID=2320858 RepID=A0A385YW88_9BACL|nr:DUF87 domain-containing protein [Paenisporosarcina cavernae]
MIFSDHEEESDHLSTNEIEHTYTKKTPFRFPVLSDDEVEKWKNISIPNDTVIEPTKPNYKSTPEPASVIKNRTKPTLSATKKMYRPTEFISPIHGKNQSTPKPIEELLKAKENQVRSEDSIEHAQPTESHQVDKATIERHHSMIQPNVNTIENNEKSFSITNETKQIPSDSSPNERTALTSNSAKNQSSDVLEKHLATSNVSTISTETTRNHTKGQNAPSIVTAGDSSDSPLKGGEHQSSQETPKETKKSLPFNVMMLSSDKKRLAEKQDVPFAKQMERNHIEVPANHVSTDSSVQGGVTISEETPELSSVNDGVRNNPTRTISEENSTSLEQPVSTNYTSNETDSGHRSPSTHLFPPAHLLNQPLGEVQDLEWMQHQAAQLVEALSYFQVKGEVVQMVQGPAVTQFELKVSQGTKVSKIRNLADDLKLALAARDIRIQAPIPGKSSIGIEIPNRTSRAVNLSEVTNHSTFMNSESPVQAALGLDLTGTPISIDLRKMPHGLIAGATGSGKSVCINSLLVSLLYKASPKDLKLLLIDPKVVELAPFNHIPHLISPVITDVKAATAALKWAVEEMERRYQLFAHSGARDIERYNHLAENNKSYSLKLPYIVIVIDELADLMMMAPSEVEESICRIAQKARACGIHLILATQRPSVDVITGLIKANIPTRIAFSVSSQIDSRTILDTQGAERLLGRGDMLYLGNGMSSPIRIQGTFVTDDEIEQIVEHARAQGEPDYVFVQEELIKRVDSAVDQDELLEEACRFIVEQSSASTSLLQRKFHIGYNRAARLIDSMEEQGFISGQNGSKPREVLISSSDITSFFD